MSEGLKTFLGAIRSEHMDARNRNRVGCNLPPDELAALKELICLQWERVIIVKPGAKGAGIIILDFKEYLRVCYEHLLSVQKTEGGDIKLYYENINYTSLDEAKNKILSIIQEGLDNNIITTEEFKAMDPQDKNPSKFYVLFKMHKKAPFYVCPTP